MSASEATSESPPETEPKCLNISEPRASQDNHTIPKTETSMINSDAATRFVD